jgi:hypothetical protein
LAPTRPSWSRPYPKGFLAAPPSRATECWQTDVAHVGLADGSAIGYRAHQLEPTTAVHNARGSVSDVSRHHRERVTVSELVTLTWAGAGERVTGIEPANPHYQLGNRLAGNLCDRLLTWWSAEHGGRRRANERPQVTDAARAIGHGPVTKSTDDGPRTTHLVPTGGRVRARLIVRWATNSNPGGRRLARRVMRDGP